MHGFRSGPSVREDCVWVIGQMHFITCSSLKQFTSQIAYFLMCRCLQEVLTGYRAGHKLSSKLIAVTFKELSAVYIEAKQYVSVEGGRLRGRKRGVAIG